MFEYWFGSVADPIGYLGAAVVGLAYFLNQRGSLMSEDWRFPGMNLCGSILIVISLFYRMNPPSVVIEIFWSAISLYGIQKNVRAARRTATAEGAADDRPG
jgi:hypothetical protein